MSNYSLSPIKKNSQKSDSSSNNSEAKTNWSFLPRFSTPKSNSSIFNNKNKTESIKNQLCDRYINNEGHEIFKIKEGNNTNYHYSENKLLYTESNIKLFSFTLLKFK